jgi:membrane associated rhomboid family serine protease
MLNELATSLQTIIDGVKNNYVFTLSILGIMWVLLFINLLFKMRLCILGIYPRRLFGLVGIVFAPFLHGSFEHLLFNSMPLFLLMNFVLLSGYQTFYIVTITIMLIAGGLTWLLGRSAIHIGASYVVMGYFGYLLCAAYFNLTMLSVGLALIALYYFGGILLSVFPAEDKISWESHLFGLIAGIITCLLLMKTDFVLIILQLPLFTYKTI